MSSPVLPTKPRKKRRRIVLGIALVTVVGGCAAIGAGAAAEMRAAEEERVASVAACNDELRETDAALATLDGPLREAERLYSRTADRLADDEVRAELGAAVAAATAKGEAHPEVCDAGLAAEDAALLAEQVVRTREAVPAASRALSESKDRAVASLVPLYAADVDAARAELVAAIGEGADALSASAGRVLDEAAREALGRAISAAESVVVADVEHDLAALEAALTSLREQRSAVATGVTQVTEAATAWEREQERIAEERAAREREERRERQISALGLVPAQVTRVIDGDTLEVTVDGRTERVRLIGVDAPEIGASGADAATAFTRDAIAGVANRVYLQRDGNDRDRFDRLRRHVWLDVPTSSRDDEQRRTLLLNRMLVDAGHAVVATPPAPTPARPSAPAPAAEERAPFRNCTEVWNVLGRPIHRGEPGFHSRLDRDDDGIGCERDPR